MDLDLRARDQDNYHINGCRDGRKQRFNDEGNLSIGICYSWELSNNWFISVNGVGFEGPAPG